MTVSQLSATDIAIDFGVMPNTISVVPNGVDTALFRPLPGVSRRPRQVIATASADAPLKGLAVLLRAFKNLVDADPSTELVLIARPKPGGDTEALIEQLGLRDRIRFVGDASHKQINRLYAESAVAVVPSLYEGFGLAWFSNAAGHSSCFDRWWRAEVVGEGGLQVRAGDSAALADAMHMFSDSNWRTHWRGEGSRARGSSSAGQCASDGDPREYRHANGRSRQARSRTWADLPG